VSILRRALSKAAGAWPFGKLRRFTIRHANAKVATMGARLSDGEQGAEPAEALDPAAKALEQALSKAGARISRRMRALQGDLARIEDADSLARRARLFVSEAARAPRGASTLRAVDWSSGDPAPVELTLDPARGARQQIDALFRRARRLKDGAPIALARLRDAQKMLAALDAIAQELVGTQGVDLEVLTARALGIAPRDFPRPPAPGGRRKRDAPLPPYRTFVAASGAHILVGRGAAHNDALTLHVARPHHLWLHAKGQAGAHVVVVLDKGASCPANLLVEAAHLAAHFSHARREPVVEVTYVERRHVRKPRGSPPGLVVVSREKVLVLRRSDDLVRRLLDRELAP
jgi:predicted ribosome quality control (RQC) complex YloA/Tae2 family protein